MTIYSGVRNLILSVIFFGVAVYLGSIIFDKLTEQSFLDKNGASPAAFPVYGYPAKLELSSKTGNALGVSLIGRSESKIQFIRVGDGEIFVYPIADLSRSSQEIVLNYPINGLQNASDYMTGGAVTLGDVYVEQLRVRIKKIDQEIDVLTKRYEASQSTADKRRIENVISDLREERIECEAKINERLSSQS
ncbi:MAG: hypothetical protein AAGC73_03455 [Verrucomicrobiota bacterium]